MNKIYSVTVLFMLIALSIIFAGCVSTKEFKRVQHNYETLDGKYLSLKNQYARLSDEKAVLEKELRNADMFHKELNKMLSERTNEVAQKNELLNNCIYKLNRAEITNILECLANLDNCNIANDEIRNSKDILIAEHRENLQRVEEKNEKIVQETEKKAHYKGMLAVWENLSIEAYPRIEKHLFTDDHYLNLVIKVNDRQFFRHEFQTENKERGFSRAFSGITSLASVITFFR